MFKYLLFNVIQILGDRVDFDLDEATLKEKVTELITNESKKDAVSFNDTNYDRALHPVATLFYLHIPQSYNLVYSASDCICLQELGALEEKLKETEEKLKYQKEIYHTTVYDLKKVERSTFETDTRVHELEDELASRDVLNDTLRRDKSEVSNKKMLVVAKKTKDIATFFINFQIIFEFGQRQRRLQKKIITFIECDRTTLKLTNVFYCFTVCTLFTRTG